ncbi:inter-alpha-trypsin inhibitor heavy chain H6-like [Peromyscus leucopus]|uniref:inter-alpha-trypsin inhibitor heavy chain H6-like n=1 Tax=Peromyscus leucopus TaxID=10041 RepID=UPI001884A0C7|nr:inter-alpha-trypsin inhibitor heavy chain H6-like [Peromyscus leucopus]
MGQLEGHARLVEPLGVRGLHFSLSPHMAPSLSPSMAFLSTEPPSHLNTHTGEGDAPPSTRIQRGETCVRITFSPTLHDQSAFSRSGIMADFTVHYDVAMEDIIGDVQIYGGYFIHYFAPRGLPPVEKNVVFVIDVSGSMFGTKLQQVTRPFPGASEIHNCLPF